MRFKSDRFFQWDTGVARLVTKLKTFREPTVRLTNYLKGHLLLCKQRHILDTAVMWSRLVLLMVIRVQAKLALNYYY